MTRRKVDPRPRSLTEADVDAIADALQERLKAEFYKDLGKGVWGWVKKGVIGLMIAAAYYGWNHK